MHQICDYVPTAHNPNNPYHSFDDEDACRVLGGTLLILAHALKIEVNHFYCIIKRITNETIENPEYRFPMNETDEEVQRAVDMIQKVYELLDVPAEDFHVYGLHFFNAVELLRPIINKARDAIDRGIYTDDFQLKLAAEVVELPDHAFNEAQALLYIKSLQNYYECLVSPEISSN